MNFRKIVLASAAMVAGALPLAAHAESNVSTAASGTLTATARVNFSITIPRLLFLQVGTGTLLGNNTNIDLIEFLPGVAVIGTGSVNATPTSGNLGNGQVTVRVIGNVGNVSLGATGPANLVAGSNTIPWTQISTAITGGATHPTINGANASFTAASNVVNINGTWTYTYLNATTPAAGTYTGQVLYTATSP
jgi:hypothetical protein